MNQATNSFFIKAVKTALFGAFFTITGFLTYAPCTAQFTIILWDIHDVILKKNHSKMIRELFYAKKWPLFKKTSRKLLYDLYRLSREKEKTGEAFLEIALQHDNMALVDLIKQVANQQKPIDDTVAIIKELKQNGYVNHIGSNIGPIIFDDLKQKLPDVFKSNLFDFDKSQLASYKKGKVLCKPDTTFFIQYLQKNNLDPNKTKIIFIDDKIENVEAAQQVGIIGIHFKNPNQLRVDLINHGIHIGAPHAAPKMIA